MRLSASFIASSARVRSELASLDTTGTSDGSRSIRRSSFAVSKTNQPPRITTGSPSPSPTCIFVERVAATSFSLSTGSMAGSEAPMNGVMVRIRTKSRGARSSGPSSGRRRNTFHGRPGKTANHAAHEKKHPSVRWPEWHPTSLKTTLMLLPQPLWPSRNACRALA